MIQKRKILFLTRLYHPHIGGVEKHVYEMSKVLRRRGFQITLITERFDEKLLLEEVVEGVRVLRIPVSKNNKLKKFLIWKWMLFHLNLLFSHKIIHVHDVFYWLFPFRILIPFKKIYITFHGYEDFPIKKGWIHQRKIAEMLTNGNICVGKFMKKWYKTTPTSIIYGGVRLTSKNTLPKNQGAVFFGRLDEQTGISQYLLAYKKIKQRFPNFSLTVVGEGKLRKKIPPDVKIIGFRKNIFPFIRENRIIFVSRYLSMLEALASNREVVATYDNPVKKDYLNLSPFHKFVHVGKDAEEISNIVIGILKQKGTSDRLKEATEWAKSQTWELVADDYFRLWDIT